MIAGVLLAAGLSRRMGRNKLLLPHRGRPLAAWGLCALCGSDLDTVICVTGHEAEAVREALGPWAPEGRVRFVHNPDFASGRASSVRAALARLPGGCEAALFLPGDVPSVTSDSVDALLERHRRTRCPLAVAVSPSGEKSHPVLFTRPFFAHLAALEGDESGQRLLLSRWDAVEKVPACASFADVDTPEDYRALLGEAG